MHRSDGGQHSGNLHLVSSGTTTDRVVRDEKTGSGKLQKQYGRRSSNVFSHISTLFRV